jgi:hypothetical protein
MLKYPIASASHAVTRWRPLFRWEDKFLPRFSACYKKFAVSTSGSYPENLLYDLFWYALMSSPSPSFIDIQQFDQANGFGLAQ